MQTTYSQRSLAFRLYAYMDIFGFGCAFACFSLQIVHIFDGLKAEIQQMGSE